MKEAIKRCLDESADVKKTIAQSEKLLEAIQNLASVCISCLNRGGKLVLCGNGGSASDALHFAGEIVGRFQRERHPWPAIALNADVATMTAIANDYGYDNVFARQVEGLICPNDLFIGISTSGNSENILKAALAAGDAGGISAALLGGDGGKLGAVVDYPVIVPSSVTARVQESHITIIHILCELIEDKVQI